MSNFIYPLGIIDKQKVTPTNSVISDAFENGTTMTRLLWNAQNFKRKFEITHSSLTLAEWRYLRSFYSQRSGMFDAFWYRDNVNRRGNANVRFSAALPENHDGVLYNAQVTMDEIAPVRTLPELDEVIAAAGSTPLLWYDANREFYLTHVGNIITEPAVYDAANQKYPGTWTTGSSLFLGGITEQYQYYCFKGSNWSDSAIVAELATGTPACTIFVFCRHTVPVAAYTELLFSLGSESTNGPDMTNWGMGLQLTADNFYVPWIGPAEPFFTCRFDNGAGDIWRSVAVTFDSGVGNTSLVVNGVADTVASPTRAFRQGPAVFGTSPRHLYPANPANDVANANIAHLMVFNTALTVAQIKALHNLLGYQYGLSLVP